MQVTPSDGTWKTSCGEKKNISILNVLGPGQHVLLCIFVEGSHSNQEESTSLDSKEGSEVTVVGQHPGADATLALETIQVLKSAASVCIIIYLLLTN